VYLNNIPVLLTILIIATKEAKIRLMPLIVEIWIQFLQTALLNLNCVFGGAVLDLLYPTASQRSLVTTGHWNCPLCLLRETAGNSDG